MSSLYVPSILDAEHGPYGPLPYVTLALFVLDAVGLALWCASWLRHEALRLPLQRLLTVLPVAKLLVGASMWAYWWHCAPRGYGGTCSAAVLGIYRVTDVLFSLTLYTTLMLLAKGFGLLRYHIPPLEFRSMVWNLAVLGIAMAARALRIPVPFFIILMVVLAQIYSNISSNLQLLETYLYSLMALRINPITTPFFRKAFLLKKLQYLITFYMVLQVLIQFKLHFTVATSVLFQCLADGGSDAALLWGLGFLYRLRPEVAPEEQLSPRPDPRAAPPAPADPPPAAVVPPEGPAGVRSTSPAASPAPEAEVDGDHEGDEAPLYASVPAEESAPSTPVSPTATLGFEGRDGRIVPVSLSTPPAVPSTLPIPTAPTAGQHTLDIVFAAPAPRPRPSRIPLSPAAQATLRTGCLERWVFGGFLLQFDAPALLPWDPRLLSPGAGQSALGLRPFVPTHTLARVVAPTPAQLAKATCIVVEDPPGAPPGRRSVYLGTRLPPPTYSVSVGRTAAVGTAT